MTTDSRSLESAMLTLFCYLRGDDYRQVFPVEINKGKSASHLKEAIKEKKRPKFDDIPADSLALWKVSVKYTEDLKNEVEALNLVDGNKLRPLEELSSIFSDLEGKRVHVIIDRPYSGELLMSLLSFLFSTCVTSGRVSGLSTSNLSAPHESTLQK
jgi:Crinkler effector protein N-terminal domain